MMDRRFPRSNRYHPDWLFAGVSGGANPLWLTEWLTTTIDLRPGMRVLDLGCGRALSSIFLHREFDVQVWATDLWFSPSENAQRIRDAGVADHVFPVHADCRHLPFANDFFDVIISIDSFVYYGTDDLYLHYLARFLKPGGVLAIAGAGLMQEIDTAIPVALKSWWEPTLCCLHSAAWWRLHWERSGIVDVELSDSMPDGWRLWLEWQKTIAPNNLAEIRALESDCGAYLGYVRTVGRRRLGIRLEDLNPSIPPDYIAHPLLRD